MVGEEQCGGHESAAVREVSPAQRDRRGAAVTRPPPQRCRRAVADVQAQRGRGEPLSG